MTTFLSLSAWRGCSFTALAGNRMAELSTTNTGCPGLGICIDYWVSPCAYNYLRRNLPKSSDVVVLVGLWVCHAVNFMPC
ncbi:hypothetical protein L209DRAFT_750461 [Thermothelomyces heterothallicus CBS 203.75]